MRSGDLLQLEIEKPAAGGRMLARHQGRIVLVSGAIPGERVSARLERVTGAVAFAEALGVERASGDRRGDRIDVRCGGCAFGHITYERQLGLKQEIVQDAFSRIARAPMRERPAIVRSPEQGYRMRARLHAAGGRLGFFREGTHEICDAGSTGQLAAATIEWISRVSDVLGTRRLEELAGVEIAETMAGDERVCHLDLHQGADAEPFQVLADGVSGLSAQAEERGEVAVLSGAPYVTDSIDVATPPQGQGTTLRRNVRAFFQSNRYLVETLARHVAALVADGPVVDLYAGVGLFGLTLAGRGASAVTLVEGDAVSGDDLEANAEPHAQAVVERQRVETFVTARGFARLAGEATVIVDPPRTGLSKPVLEGILRTAARRLVYVSCDPATLARDSRGLLDGGYEIADTTLFDMFPNTAHIESVVSFVRN